MRKKIVLNAFILKKRVLLNKDVLVTLFTEEKGKLTIVAKGVRKIISRRLSYLDTGNLVEVVLNNPKEGRFYLVTINLVSGFLNIKKEKRKYNNFYRSLYLIDRLLPEAQAEKDTYRELKLFLFGLARGRMGDDKEKLFFSRVLKTLGYIDSSFENRDLSPKIEEIINQKLPRLMI